MAAAELRVAPARDDDLAAIDAFLAARTDTCMILRSNLRAVGLAWSGARYQAEYVVARRGGALVGVAGHAWNGALLLQADDAVDQLARAAVARSRRRVTSIQGPADQVARARGALGLGAAPAALDAEETMLALDLAALRVPAPLAGGEVRARRADAADRSWLVGWRAAYLVETLGVAAGPATEARAASAIDAAIAERHLWLVEHAGAPAAISMFNARLPDAVQVGGVYTPPPRRGRGFARSVVAAALLDARGAGVTRAVLYTPSADALAAYRALGFEVIGRYGLVELAA